MTIEPPDASAAARHAEKMRRKKAARDKIVASKTREKGLLIVHTGKGKGKSTAAFGMVFRALGHGMRVGAVQFVKGAWTSGERTSLERFAEQIEIRAMGEGFTWETQDLERDLAAAQAAWERAEEMLNDESLDMILLDELNIVLRYGYLPTDRVLRSIAERRRRDAHVIVTGRNAKPEMIDAADLVTEMTFVKHPFRSGVKAQRGVEF